MANNKDGADFPPSPGYVDRQLSTISQMAVEIHNLKQELRTAKRVIWAMVHAQGGQYRLSEHALQNIRNAMDPKLDISYSPANKEWTLEAK